MSKLGKDLIQGLKEALAHASGEDTGALVHVFEVPDVKAIREDLHLTQSEFSEAYKIPLTTLQGWEQGVCLPQCYRPHAERNTGGTAPVNVT